MFSSHVVNRANQPNQRVSMCALNIWCCINSHAPSSTHKLPTNDGSICGMLFHIGVTTCNIECYICKTNKTTKCIRPSRLSQYPGNNFTFYLLITTIFILSKKTAVFLFFMIQRLFKLEYLQKIMNMNNITEVKEKQKQNKPNISNKQSNAHLLAAMYFELKFPGFVQNQFCNFSEAQLN